MNSDSINKKSQATPPAPSRIRVLLVDDSPVVLALLQKMLAGSLDVEVVGTARHGKEALELIPRLQPQVICTDLHMPVMDGLQFTREVMARFPRPILVVSSNVRADEQDKVFPLLQAGALDVFPKPSNVLQGDGQAARQFANKIKIISKVPVFTRHLRTTAVAPSARLTPSRLSREAAPDAATAQAIHAGDIPRRGSSPVSIVAMGASTGGPQTLQTILSRLPANFPVPILCVQHISQGFLQGLVDWLATQCSLKVQIARSGDLPKPGTVYFPVEGLHLELDAQKRLVASREPPVDGHRPSATALFKSVARRYGDKALAVLLTGMGRDGAEGMWTIAQAGGMTIAQDEASSVVFGMPKQAIDLGAAQLVLPDDEIAATLIKYVRG